MSDELVDAVMEEAKASGLNAIVAILVALTATIMAVGKVKSDNVVQAMQVIKSDQVDTWAFYQAKSTKENLAEVAVDQFVVLRDSATTASGQSKEHVEKAIQEYSAKRKRYEAEKEELKKSAEALQARYDTLSMQDDQFDLSDAAFSISLSLFALTALTRKRWLLAVGIVFAAVGTLMSVAGFCALSWLHPEFLVRLLS